MRVSFERESTHSCNLLLDQLFLEVPGHVAKVRIREERYDNGHDRQGDDPESVSPFAQQLVFVEYRRIPRRPDTGRAMRPGPTMQGAGRTLCHCAHD